jgi:hypothetical protein
VNCTFMFDWTEYPSMLQCASPRRRDGSNLFYIFIFRKSRGSSVGIVTGYGLEDRGSGVRFPAGALSPR